MKVQRVSGSDERLTLIGLIVHDDVLGKIFSVVGQDRPFLNKWSNLIAGWCFEYYKKYGKAPGRSIESIFAHYAKSSRDVDAVGLVEGFLQSLDEQYKALRSGLNVDFVVDRACELFNKARLTRVNELVEQALETNSVDEALQAHAEFRPLAFAANDWKDPLSKEFIKEVFTRKEREERLIEFKGDMGKFLSPHLKRGDFVSFMGPDKRGKSFWIQEMVWQALRQQRRVLYYVLGDMSAYDVGMRLAVRMTRKPAEKQELQIPVELRCVRGEDLPRVLREKHVRGAVHPREVWECGQNLLQATGAKQSRLKLRCEGGGVISASMIEQDVQKFTREDWVPDVVAIDYADEMDAEQVSKNLDVRHQINATWQILRRIALNQHCLVLTASQAAATAYASNLIRKKDFSEDKRKNAHVTGMIGINQTDTEKELGLYRLNWIVLRGGRWSESQVLHTAGELGIGCPCLLSCFPAPRGKKKDDHD